MIHNNKYFIGLIIFLTSFMLFEAIMRYINLQSSILDLGVLSHGAFIFNTTDTLREMISGHVHAYLFLISALYDFYESPITLILFQFIVTISSIYFIIKLSVNYVQVSILVFVLCYAVWYNIVFDFHYDHISILLMMAFYYFIYANKKNLAFIMALLIPLIKEPFGLVSSFMGIYFIVKSKDYIRGTLLLIYGFSYFYITTHFIIPFFADNYSVVGEGLTTFGNGGGLLDIALYPIINFVDFIVDIFTTKKVVYLAALFLAFGLVVVFFSPLELIPAIPLLAISMLSNFEGYFIYQRHYTASLVAPFLVAFIFGLPKAIRFFQENFHMSEKHILVVIFIPIILSHVIFSTSPFSRFFWMNKIEGYYWKAYLPNDRNTIIKNAMVEYIPSDINVSVSSQNHLNYEHIINRSYYFPFPMGVLSATSVQYIDSNGSFDTFRHLVVNDKTIVKRRYIRSDFVTIDTKKTLCLVDRDATKNEFLDAVNTMEEDYKVIYEYDGFMIYKRNNLDE